MKSKNSMQKSIREIHNSNLVTYKNCTPEMLLKEIMILETQIINISHNIGSLTQIYYDKMKRIEK